VLATNLQDLVIEVMFKSSEVLPNKCPYCKTKNDDNLMFCKKCSKLLWNRLPKSKFDVGMGVDECVVCYDTFVQSVDDVTFLPCMHAFHFDCIGDWLQKKPTCPVCVVELTPENTSVQ